MPTSPFNISVWGPALEKYGGVTRLTVILFDGQGQIVCGPINRTPVFDAFADATADALFTECAQRCLREGDPRAAVVVARQSGLAVVGTPLVLNDQVVGAAVGGYHLVDFPQAVAIERATREAGSRSRTSGTLSGRRRRCHAHGSSSKASSCR